MAVPADACKTSCASWAAVRPACLGSPAPVSKLRCRPATGNFLERLCLTGDIGIGDARFTTTHGEDDSANVVSDLQGRVSVANGVATLTGITFNVPGASAVVSGTYNLITKRVDLSGTVRLEEKLSQTTKGIKSFLLKPLDPFFRKKKHLSVVPIRISGSYGHTSISLKL
jgi:hypothetical protein